MYCKKCGSEVKEGQKFCLKCKAPVEEMQEAVVQKTGESMESTAAGRPKKRHTGILVIVLIILILVVIVAAAVLLSARREPTIDLNKYTRVSYDGVERFGEASAVIDYNAIDKDYEKRVKIKTDADTWLWGTGLSAGEILPYLVSVSVDPEQGLSNGDIITVSYTMDGERTEQLLGCKIKYKEQTYMVEGLEEIQLIDVFDGVELDFTGTAPQGKAELKTGGRFGQAFNNTYSWKAEPDSGLSNGDTVTLLFEVGDEQDFIEEFGGMPAELSKTYTVAGLDSYITDMAQLSKEHMKALKKEAKDQIDTDCAGYDFMYTVKRCFGIDSLIDSVEIGSDYTLKNIYFLCAKESGGARHTSIPVFVYSIPAKIFRYKDKELLKSGEFYITVAFTDLVLEDGGNLVGTATNRVNEYGSTDEAYTNWVTSNKDNYTIAVYDGNLQKIE